MVKNNFWKAFPWSSQQHHLALACSQYVVAILVHTQLNDIKLIYTYSTVIGQSEYPMLSAQMLRFNFFPLPAAVSSAPVHASSAAANKT